MSIAPEDAQKQKMASIDNLVYNTFTKKFNNQYSHDLLKEQKDLLSNFISSFVDNGLQLKIYLNEEVRRLKTELKKSLLIEEFREDEGMLNKAKEIVSLLESYKEIRPGKEMVQQIIKIQSLVSEIKENATH